MLSRGPYWLTVPEAALQLKLRTAAFRRLIRSGKRSTLEIDAVGVRVISREAVEPVKEEIAAGHLQVLDRCHYNPNR